MRLVRAYIDAAGLQKLYIYIVVIMIKQFHINTNVGLVSGISKPSNLKYARYKAGFYN